MPQYFSRRWSDRARLLFYGGPILALVLAGIGMGVQTSPGMRGVGDPVMQPVAFSHQTHVGQLRLDCRYCHASVEESAFAGMPATEVCMGCHQQVWTALADMEPLAASWETRIPVAWRRVHDMPDLARFDHSIHVHKGIGCVTCHGRVDRMPQVWQAESLDMEWCLECHRSPEEHLWPRETVFDPAWEFPSQPDELAALGTRLGIEPPPESAAELRLALMKEYQVREQTSCSHCHQ